MFRQFGAARFRIFMDIRLSDLMITDTGQIADTAVARAAET